MGILPFLKRALPLPRLVRLMWRPPKVQARCHDNERSTIRLVERLCQIRGGNCLTRSLILYRLLVEVNASPRMVIGFVRREGELLGHAWVTVDGHALLEEPAALDGCTEFAAFAQNGVQEQPIITTRRR